MRIYIAPGNPVDSSAYLGEILTTFGLCFHTTTSLSLALETANAQNDCIVLAAGCLVDQSTLTGIDKFLRAGGSAVAILPDASIERFAGLVRVGEEDGLSRLRLVHAVCHGSRGETLSTHGSWRRYETPLPANDAAVADGMVSQPIAYLFQPGVAVDDSIGIVEWQIGNGRLLVYAYDPAYCIRRLRQGYPERANFLPPGQITPRAAFLQLPNPPADTFWRPTADLHALTFCELIRRMLERHAPLPALWHLPGYEAAIVLFSGDEDAGEQDANESQMSELEGFDAAMNLYVFPANTSIDRTRIEAFTRRGHTVSVHPFLSDTADEPPANQIAKAESEVRLFSEKFDWPVRTVRNHSYMWPGYLDLPELWERLGIGMDANSTSTLRGESPDWGPFVKLNAAMPLRFVREDGRLIDVFQQPTHLNDDQMSHPTSMRSHKYSLSESAAMMERVLDDAVNIDHSPICVNFHPQNYVNFSGEHGRALLQLAQDAGVPVWSIERWHAFWRARDSWRLHSYRWANRVLQFTLQGERCEHLTVSLPAEFENAPLEEVRINGALTPFQVLLRRGRTLAQAILLSDSRSVDINAQYGDLNNASPAFSEEPKS